MKRQISIVDNNNDSTIIPRRTVTISPLKRAREDDEDPIERRKVQVLSVNQDIRRPTGLFSYEEEPKRNGEDLLHIAQFYN
jgi:hypothetical protein